MPALTNRAALKITKLVAGGPDLCTTERSDQAEPEAHYMLIEIEGNRWDNWFVRLDRLIKCLYNVVREAQEDPYVAPIGVTLQ